MAFAIKDENVLFGAIMHGDNGWTHVGYKRGLVFRNSHEVCLYSICVDGFLWELVRPCLENRRFDIYGYDILKTDLRTNAISVSQLDLIYCCGSVNKLVNENDKSVMRKVFVPLMLEERVALVMQYGAAQCE